MALHLALGTWHLAKQQGKFIHCDLSEMKNLKKKRKRKSSIHCNSLLMAQESHAIHSCTWHLALGTNNKVNSLGSAEFMCGSNSIPTTHLGRRRLTGRFSITFSPFARRQP